MTTDRIKEIQDKTAYPNSVSVQQALLQVWNECKEEDYHKKYTEDDIYMALEFGRSHSSMTDKQFIESLKR